MDEATCSTNALPPFLTKTYEMVEDSSCDAIVSWSSSNKSFIVWNPPDFARDLLPRYFKHNNFSSFIRQLNTYGFSKVDPEKWEFANKDNFVRGQPHLLKNIHRRKPVHSHSAQNLHGLSPPLTESERQGYKEDIQKLKHENDSLCLDLQRPKQGHQGLELQMQVLTERVQHVEHRQKTMLSAFTQTLDKPVTDLSHMPQLQVNDRKRRLPGNSCLYNNETDLEDTREISSRALTLENLNPSSLLTMNVELLEQLASSLTFWEDVLQDVDQAGIQQNCSLQLNESTSCADSPAISYTQLNLVIGPKASGIDMNSEPNANTIPEVAEPEDQVAVAGPAINVATGVNDVFWEQFLTENPGSVDASEVQSERKDIGSKKSESKPVDGGKYWLNMKSVNSLAEQLGHLNPAENLIW